MTKLTHEQAQLLREPNFGVVASLKPDGAARTTIVWVDWDGENVVFNTTRSRAKGRNLRRDPRVSVLVWDRNDPLRYLEVEGEAELDEEGGVEHIHALARKYTGADYDGGALDRVIVRVRPKRVYVYGIGE
jgi:PPOX class probable F420-dependent enzyme